MLDREDKIDSLLFSVISCFSSVCSIITTVNALHSLKFCARSPIHGNFFFEKLYATETALL